MAHPIKPLFMLAIIRAAYSELTRRCSGDAVAAHGVPKRGRAKGRCVSPHGESDYRRRQLRYNLPIFRNIAAWFVVWAGPITKSVSTPPSELITLGPQGWWVTMWASHLALIEPSLKHAPSLVAMVNEYRCAGERRYHDLPALSDREAPGYVAQLMLRARGFDPKPSHVQQFTWWLVRDETIIGASRFRPILTPALHEWGGHISYDIRPSERGKGHGTRILELTLDKARRFRMSRVRLMCYQDNIASAKIIERNGGALVYDGPCPLAGGNIFTYEISL
jgi:predicted acetyltransferase